MIKFSELFKFSRSEVFSFFEKTEFRDQTRGLRLVRVAQNFLEPTPSFGRLLIIIPRMCGKAILRNKLRRRLKSIFYEEHLYSRSGVSIIIAYKNATLLSYDELKSFLLKNISRE